jgi:hypothetical protein
MIPKIPADISLPEPILGTSSMIAFIFGCLFIYLALSRIRRLKPGISAIYGLLSFISISIAIITLLMALNIHDYQRLTFERHVGDIRFSKLDHQLYRADLVLTDTQNAVPYELRGDEWQLDARLIKWKAPLTSLGLDSVYRLDRLQGRYRDIEQAKTHPRSIFALSKSGDLDLWSLSRHYRKWLPWVDAYYGNASYTPMANNAEFQINMTQSGLIVRPINESAISSIDDWK